MASIATGWHHFNMIECDKTIDFADQHNGLMRFTPLISLSANDTPAFI